MNILEMNRHEKMGEKVNRFDKQYEIRLAYYEEIEEIMAFIDQYWKKGHILANSREFFLYEHVIDGQVTFVIAKERSSGEIHGILGYLPASSDRNRYDIWGVIWKVNEKAASMLGVELKRRIFELAGARTDLGTGANPKTAIPLLKRILHYSTGKMKQYYCVSPNVDYKIAKIEYHPRRMVTPGTGTVVKRVNSIGEVTEKFDFNAYSDVIPYKDAWYVERRYFKHPIYEYEVYALSNEGKKPGALLVCREQACNGAKALRIVDYIGDQQLFQGISEFIEKKLTEYEYIDFYCLGFEEQYILKAGFTCRKENDTNIIPNYFSPFVQKNIDIWVDSSREGCLFFKADGDQDRPN